MPPAIPTSPCPRSSTPCATALWRSPAKSTPFPLPRPLSPILQQGLDIIYIGLFLRPVRYRGLRGIAKAELLEKYPDRKIAVVDSLCASMGQGLYVYYAARLQKELDFDAM